MKNLINSIALFLLLHICVQMPLLAQYESITIPNTHLDSLKSQLNMNEIQENIIKSKYPAYKNSISISANDLLIARLLMNFSTQIKPGLYYDLTLGCRTNKIVIPYTSINGGPDLTSQDIVSFGTMERIPFNEITIRTGFKKYRNKREYFGVMINYNYKYSDQMKNYYTGFNSENYIKIKKQYGTFLKYGIMLSKNSRQEF